MRQAGVATVAQLTEFDEVIDARSPAEYADDHLPRAISCPVLDDDQRAQVGTLYNQSSPFAARKIGGVWVAQNVARHIERLFLDKPREWRPLVYCWRGGQRSGAFSHILRQIGWDAQRLEGGYKFWRRRVLADLAAWPQTLSFRVVAGTTGSGKSRLLEALASTGEQVLHLEELAAHKGSLLGDLPRTTQPSQRLFESRLHAALARLRPERPVWVEAESRRIGAVQLPDALLAAMRAAPSLRLDVPLEARVNFLLEDYGYFLADPAWLVERLTHLTGLHSRETVARWRGFAESGEFRTLVHELLERHYDPLYQRSQQKNFGAYARSPTLALADLGAASVDRLVQQLLAA